MVLWKSVACSGVLGVALAVCSIEGCAQGPAVACATTAGCDVGQICIDGLCRARSVLRDGGANTDSGAPELDGGARVDAGTDPDRDGGADSGLDAGIDPPMDGGSVLDGGAGGVDSGGGMGSDASLDSGTDAGSPPEMNIGLTVPGCDDFAVAPFAGEERHSVAIRITPPTYPFTVRQVQYTLSNRMEGGIRCDPTLAHRVSLFSGSGATPPPSPTLAWSMNLVSMATGGANRDVVANVSPPVTFTSGSEIYVSIRLAGTYPDVLCPVTCEPKVSTRSFWSNADAAPYSWGVLSSFAGVDGELAVRLVGTTP